MLFCIATTLSITIFLRELWGEYNIRFHFLKMGFLWKIMKWSWKPHSIQIGSVTSMTEGIKEEKMTNVGHSKKGGATTGRWGEWNCGGRGRFLEKEWYCNCKNFSNGKEGSWRRRLGIARNQHSQVEGRLTVKNSRFSYMFLFVCLFSIEETTASLTFTKLVQHLSSRRK